MKKRLQQTPLTRKFLLAYIKSKTVKRRHRVLRSKISDEEFDKIIAQLP